MNNSDDFKAAIAAAGLTPPDTIVSGKLTRFSTNGKKSDDAGWYIFHDDERPAGRFGCNRSGVDATWRADTRREFTPEERREWAERMRALEAERDEERKRATARAAEKAASMWAAARPADAHHHDYLQRKQIPGVGARLLRDQLIVPMRQGAGELCGLQVIQPDGSRKFLTGTPAGGAYTTIGKPTRTGPIVICEGYATGVSIHMATNWCVVVAFSAGNLAAVAAKIRKALPDAELIIGADDDAFTEGNPGRAAAAATGLPVALPLWIGERDSGTDFNDLHNAEGLDAVRACFENPQPLQREPLQREPVPMPQPPALQQLDPQPGTSVAVSPVPAGTMPRYLAVQQWGLEATDKGVPHASVANVVRILSMDESLAQKIWFDEFLDRICTVWPAGEPREWTDADDVRLQVYIQETLGMPKLGKQAVQDAVMLVARMDTRNEAKAYLDGLQWDEVERLPLFFPDCFGTDDTEYTRAVGLSFWLSIVARVTRPGCKVDTMVVLEGLQGAGKSRALSIIGGRWFTEATQAPTDKDFYMNLAGKMLVEIGEMDAFNRAEVTKVKQVITCQVDRYRAPYERRAADHPRRCVFAGTTNRDDWNKDETGARRFLPLTVVTVNHEALASMRDQFFAEAMARLARGENWWSLPAEATLEQQEARRDVDELEATVAEWMLGRSVITIKEIMDNLMKLPLERQDRMMQLRIGKALRVLGWVRKSERDGSVIRKVWRKESLAGSQSLAQQSQHDEDVPY